METANTPHYEQNTPEWVEMRKKMIGVSDAPVIMNENPYKNILRLYKEKKDLVPIYVNSFMQKGTKYESVAREYFEKKIDTWVEPVVLFHPEVSFMMASLDGLDPSEKIGVEIKCPSSQKTHEWAQKGEIPPQYRAQLQHQMACAGLESIYYYSFLVIDDTFDQIEYDEALVKVARDDSYIEEMIRKEEGFYQHLVEDIPPVVDRKKRKC